MKRRAGLSVPARPSVPQIMPTEILDAGSIKRGTPCLGAGLLHWPAAIREDKHTVIAVTLFEDANRRGGQRDRYRPTPLGLVRMYPRHAAIDINLLPCQAGDVAAAQAGFEAEGGEGSEVRRELDEQALRLSIADETNALRAILELTDTRGVSEPVPGDGTVQNGPEDAQKPISRRRLQAAARDLVDELVDQLGRDLGQILLGQMASQPRKGMAL